MRRVPARDRSPGISRADRRRRSAETGRSWRHVAHAVVETSFTAPGREHATRALAMRPCRNPSRCLSRRKDGDAVQALRAERHRDVHAATIWAATPPVSSTITAAPHGPRRSSTPIAAAYLMKWVSGAIRCVSAATPSPGQPRCQPIPSGCLTGPAPAPARWRLRRCALFYAIAAKWQGMQPANAVNLQW